MNTIEYLARKCARQLDINKNGILFPHSVQDAQNRIHIYARKIFDVRLPPERLLTRNAPDFHDRNIGDWRGRENKAARTMQTIFDRAYEIAKSRAEKRQQKRCGY